MSDIETETLPGSGGEMLPAETKTEEKKPVVEATEGQPQTEGEAQKEDPPKEEPKKRRNPTGDYIQRLQSRWNDPQALERRLADLKAKTPSLDAHGYDAESYVREAIQHDREVTRAELELERAQEQIQRVTQNFNASVSAFAEHHPDYRVVVEGIPQEFLSPELQFAIMSHERGAEIAYHIAQNDDDLFQLASVRPDLMGAAVERLAKRITAPQRQSAPAPTKPITNAPPPPATVSSRNPVDTPPDKLTDEEWYRREVERERAERRRQ